MTTSKLPSPSEVGCSADDDILEAARLKLKSALKRSGGKSFTYAASLFPHGTTDTLLGELSAAGWNYEFKADSREGDYYDVSPR